MTLSKDEIRCFFQSRAQYRSDVRRFISLASWQCSISSANAIRSDVRRFESWRKETPEELSSLSYGDLDNITGHDLLDSDYYVPSLLSGSDYSGSSVEVSNHRSFLEQFGKVEGVHDVYGGHGTFAVAIRLNAITEEMLEIFEALEDYPLISEEDLSEVEMEAQNEAWKNWARSDFERELVKQFPALEVQIEEMDESDLCELFYKLADKANEYWENETGNSAWIRIERIVAKCTEEDITRPYGDTNLVGKLF